MVFMALAAIVQLSFGQSRYGTKTGKISFHSDSKMEKIEAENKQVSCVLDASTGKIEFAALIQAFQFEKALMQEHFNENYMESTKFPKATFKGALVNPSEVKFGTPGVYKCNVAGDLTIHGVTNPAKTSAVIEVKADGSILATADFNVSCSDYKIEIPTLVKDNISNVIQVRVNAAMKSL